MKKKIHLAQQTFTCSKSAIETMQKGVKYVKVNNKNIRTMSHIPPETTENQRFSNVFRRYRRHCSGVFIVSFEHISNLFQVFPLLTLNG